MPSPRACGTPSAFRGFRDNLHDRQCGKPRTWHLKLHRNCAIYYYFNSPQSSWPVHKTNLKVKHWHPCAKPSQQMLVLDHLLARGPCPCFAGFIFTVPFFLTLTHFQSFSLQNSSVPIRHLQKNFQLGQHTLPPSLRSRNTCFCWGVCRHLHLRRESVCWHYAQVQYVNGENTSKRSENIELRSKKLFFQLGPFHILMLHLQEGQSCISAHLHLIFHPREKKTTPV